MITKIRANGTIWINIADESPPMPWAYAGVTNIEVLLNFEKQPQGGPAKFGRNIVGKVANATARPGKSAAFPAWRAVLEGDPEKRRSVFAKDHARTNAWHEFRNR
ncbi:MULTISPECIES: hypothetical protein [unclassified Mesorhizobium]|uniref:hypothetical protein n=1 Tax=unclassified Mesorhizobium TaxID=325217 RepID=UPI00333AD6E7